MTTMSKNFEDMTLAELEAELNHWDRHIASYSSWGAGYAMAKSLRRGCEAWIARRRGEQQAEVRA